MTLSCLNIKTALMEEILTKEFIEKADGAFKNARKESLKELFELGRMSISEPKGEWVLQKGIMPHYQSGGTVGSRINKLLYQLDFIIAFDWGNWDEGKRLAEPENRNGIANQPVHILIALLTNIVRADRFNEGLYDGFIEDGFIAVILEALEKHFFKKNITL